MKKVKTLHTAGISIWEIGQLIFVASPPFTNILITVSFGPAGITKDF